MSGYPGGGGVGAGGLREQRWWRRDAILLAAAGLLIVGIALTVVITWVWPLTEADDPKLGYEKMYFITQTALVVVQTVALLVVIYQLRESRRSARQQAMLEFIASRAALRPQMNERYEIVAANFYAALRVWAHMSSSHPPPTDDVRKTAFEFWGAQWGQYRLYLDGHMDDARVRYYTDYRRREAQNHEALAKNPLLQGAYNQLCVTTVAAFLDEGFIEIVDMVIVQRAPVDAVMARLHAHRERHWTGPDNDLRTMAELMRRAEERG